MQAVSFKRHRFPPDVEERLAPRGIDTSRAEADITWAVATAVA
jgi:hypothetical protein